MCLRSNSAQPSNPNSGQMNFRKIIYFKCPLFCGHGGVFNRNRQVLALACYSRNSSNSKSPYKIVQAKIKNTTSTITYENGANWELFGPKNNRFFLAEGSCGPAFLNHHSTHGSCDLHDLIDFENKDKSKLHIAFNKCPVLIKNNLQEMFPAPELITDGQNLSLITLSQSSESCLTHEKAAMKYVLAAREICQTLRLHGYWCDFLNPFSGKAFFSYHQKSLYKSDERFRGLCMKLENVKGRAKDQCLLISEDKSSKFSGSVFTNLPSMEMFKELLLDSGSLEDGNE